MPPKQSQSTCVAMARCQIGDRYPGLTQKDITEIGLTNSQTCVRGPGFPVKMMWPAGATEYQHPSGSTGEVDAVGPLYLTITNGPANNFIPRQKLEDSLFPHIPLLPIYPATCLGSGFHMVFQQLSDEAKQNNPKVNFFPHPIWGRTDTILNTEYPREVTPAGPRQYYRSVTAATHENRTPRRLCNIYWCISNDNKAWGLSGVRRDFLNGIALAEQEGDQPQVEKLRRELQEYKDGYDTVVDGVSWRISHSCLVVVVCRNMYIFDPSFPAITQQGPGAQVFTHHKQAYLIRQFRLMSTVEQVLYQVKKRTSGNDHIQNVFMGGGGNTGVTCQYDTEVFLRNLLKALKDKGANQTEEEVVVDIWSSGKFFASGQIWPLDTTASM